MANCSATDVRMLLEQHCETLRKPKSAVLFRRGEKAFGAFLVLSGQVSLNVGDEGLLPFSCGNGALIGLPATLSKGDYSMTATVTEDAELGFLPPQVLDSLMQTKADISSALLKLLSEKTLAIQQVQKALLYAQTERFRHSSSMVSRATLHL